MQGQAGNRPVSEMPLGYQVVRELAANHPGCADDQDLHVVLPLLIMPSTAAFPPHLGRRDVLHHCDDTFASYLPGARNACAEIPLINRFLLDKFIFRDCRIVFRYTSSEFTIIVARHTGLGEAGLRPG
jgi:hypothetical protein